MDSTDVFREANRWFGSVVVQEVPQPSLRVVQELLRMLDVVQPANLDVARSAIRSDHDWHDVTGVEITLAHRLDPEATILVAVGDSEAIVSWLTTHEHIDGRDDTGRRPWTTVVVDATAAILRGEYEVEDHYRGRRLVKTRVRDLVEARRIVSTTGNFSAIVPWPKQRVVTRRVDFGARR